MWITIIKKLPTNPSPPKMSIHWSTPWPDMQYHERLMERMNSPFSVVVKAHEDSKLFYEMGGRSPNWKNAKGIIYKKERIRVFPHECSITNLENFKIFLKEGAYELIPYSEAGKILMDKQLSKGQRFIFDAALIDGCDDYQAMMVAIGKNPNDVPPPMGWYRLREEYANVFCYAKEQEE